MHSGAGTDTDTGKGSVHDVGNDDDDGANAAAADAGVRVGDVGEEEDWPDGDSDGVDAEVLGMEVLGMVLDFLDLLRDVDARVRT